MWHSVPIKKQREWMNLFQSSNEILKISQACPLCGKHGLYRYYHLYRKFDSPSEYPGFIGRGGLWEWCKECKHYMHYSAAVPVWWDCDIGLSIDDLFHDPDRIYEAISEYEGGSR